MGGALAAHLGTPKGIQKGSPKANLRVILDSNAWPDHAFYLGERAISRTKLNSYSKLEALWAVLW